MLAALDARLRLRLLSVEPMKAEDLDEHMLTPEETKNKTARVFPFSAHPELKAIRGPEDENGRLRARS